ncbi:MAG: Spy/CpxP family protein refolding chaperone [Syntrophomonadaceae bacterium]
MSIQQVRRSILIGGALAAVAVMGLFAGRLLGGQMAPGLGHGPRVARMYERLADRLELSDAQRAQVRGVLKAHADEILAQVRSGMEARQALHEAVVTQAPDENVIRSLAARVGSVHADGALLIVRIRSEIWPILTPDQQQKLLAFHERMGHRGDDALQSLASFRRGVS